MIYKNKVASINEAALFLFLMSFAVFLGKSKSIKCLLMVNLLILVQDCDIFVRTISEKITLAEIVVNFTADIIRLNGRMGSKITRVRLYKMIDQIIVRHGISWGIRSYSRLNSKNL